MKRYISILVLLIILVSCEKHKIKNLHGLWRFDFDRQIENPLFPIWLCFREDTLYMVDGNNFNHRTNFYVKNDTLKLVYSNGNKLNIKFNFESDSILLFGEGKFHRMSLEYLEYFNFTQYNDLIGYKTNETLKEHGNSNIIHLIKVNGKAQVILNNVTTDLKYIPDFLSWSHYPPPSLLLYLGKGIEFKDLVEAYKWISLSGIYRVSLVIGHNTVNEFYIERDYININDSLIDAFLKYEKIPPFPPPPINLKLINPIVIGIKDSTDFEKLRTIIDSVNYLIQVDEQIELLEYFELKKIIRNKRNVIKEI